MNDIQKRFTLFLLGCMGARFGLVYLSKTIKNPTFITLLGIILVAIGTSFMVLYLNDCRKTGAEVFGQKIWWSKQRIIFGLIYLLFAIYAIKGEKFAWKILILDPIFGLIIFLLHHNYI